MNISPDRRQLLLQELAKLKQEHREVDLSIEQLTKKLNYNQLEVNRLKKQKLQLKDFITQLESNLIPNLHA